MYNTSQLIQGMKAFNIDLTDKQCDQFIKYYELLVEWNEVMNLTTITEYDEVIQKHFIDSAAIRLVKDNPTGKLIDVGTGAGFPGIPLKIIYPKLQVTLADSLNKRVKFLQEVINVLGLEGIEAVHGRAEDLGLLPSYREQYDLVVSRAVASLPVLSEYCMPFVRLKGAFIAYKSSNVLDEVNLGKKAVKVFGGKDIEVHVYQLPESDISRSLLKMDKYKTTPKTYPRKAGKPSKEPII